MQKTLRINLLARNQATKIAHKKNKAVAKENWKNYQSQKETVENKRLEYIREERANRREDWLLGPLAPNRDSGAHRGSFGAVEIALAQSPALPRHIQETPKIAGFEAREWQGRDEHRRFKGDTIVGNVVVNDRVVVVHGPDRIKGQVAVVTSVEPDSETVKLRGVNTLDVRVPAAHALANSNNPETAPKFETIEAPVPISWLRLCYDTTNPTTGEPMLVIVRHVHAEAPYVQRPRNSNLPAHTRYITGSEAFSHDGQPIEIPWPKTIIDHTPEDSEGETDEATRAVSTWRPELYNAPLGYVAYVCDSDQTNNVPDIKDPRTKYEAGLLLANERPNANNVERAGLHGFVDANKAQERQKRITRSIMGELRDKTKRAATMHDDAEWVKMKMLEDARAIWWRDRMMTAGRSPVTQAIEQEVQKRQQQRQEAMAQHMQSLESFRAGVKEQKEMKEKDQQEEASRLVTKNNQDRRQIEDFASLVSEVQQLTVAGRYKKPDVKFSKRLARM